MKIFLSGVEHKEYGPAAIKAGASNVLSSFFLWRNGIGNEGPVWEQILGSARTRMGDSGAFTFRAAGLNQGGAAVGVLGTDFDAYLNDYKAWVTKYSRRGLIDYWVELDIGLVVGKQWVLQQRNDMIAAGLGRGLIQVWHSGEHDWQDWIDLCEESRRPGRSRYVAIEGHQPNMPQHKYERFIKVAYDRGVRVHGFKITGHKELKRWPFYSVDSTSWLGVVRFGQDVTMIRSGGVSSGVRGGDRRHVVSAPMRGTSARQRFNLVFDSARAWVTAERQITDLWAARGVDWDAAIARPAL